MKIRIVGKSRPELPGCIEIDKESMLRWIKAYAKRKSKIIKYIDIYNSLRVIIIKSVNKLENFKRNINF